MSRAEHIEVDAPQHWIEDQYKRDKLTQLRDRLGLTTDDVMEALGGVQLVSEYEGTYEAALQDVRDFARGRILRLMERLNPNPPEHHEAQAIAWTSVKVGGYLINVTARQGATPETVAVTVLALVGAIDILEERGVKTAR